MAFETKTLRRKLAELKKADTASKSRSKRRENCATAVDRRVATLETKPASAKALHAHLAEAAARAEADENKARTDLQDALARLVEVGQQA